MPPKSLKTIAAAAALSVLPPSPPLSVEERVAIQSVNNSTREGPFSIDHFESECPEIVAFVRELNEHVRAGKRHIGVKAPVKSGKKIIVEVIAILLGVRVKYITSLNRKDVKSQQAELATYNVMTHIMDRKAEKPDIAIREIRSDLAKSTSLVCFDECDYGSGAGQVIEPLFREFIDDARVIKVYFSATFHETAMSLLAERADFVKMEYVPPATYCGAGYFLRENLVFDPHPFFELEDGTLSITAHARQVIRESIAPSRHIGVVRVAGKDTPMNLFKDADKRKVLEQRLADNVPGKRWQIVPIDDKSPFDWESEETRDGYVKNENKNYLFVIKQTCTRGTDLKGWHPKLAFWHDARPAPKTNLNTTIQAFLRPSHYSTMPGYNGPQPIRLYVDRTVVQMAVDDDMDAYLKSGGKAPARTRVRKTQDYALSEETFNSVEEARRYGQENYGTTYPRHIGDDGCYPYRGERRHLRLENETRSIELGEGVKDAARIIPFLRNGAGEIGYLIAYSLNNDSNSVSSGSRTIAVETTKKSMYSKK